MRVRRDKRVSWRSDSPAWTVSNNGTPPHGHLTLPFTSNIFGMAATFSAAHRSYVKSLYKRMLKNELDWTVSGNHFRGRALAIRAEFDRNRCAVALCARVRAKTNGMCAVTFRTLERLRPFWRRPRLSSRLTSTRTRTSVSIRRPLGLCQCINTPRYAAPMSPGGTKWCVFVLCAAHTLLTLHFRERNLPVGRRFVVPRRCSPHPSLRFNVRSTTLPRTRSTSPRVLRMPVLQSVYLRRSNYVDLEIPD
jgi:hypothetical protein